ncbi:hemolysin XhlA family protein [Anaerophilus nitritogenes]|uniref:hemolysin XhlA family protein n=1 Tax=Anaerophilus nitritogenes TaxID=2498136 RepID=UPI00101BC47B|nr:hemolysin XhlA family protein [Anaerophilus nitritogenes]
MEDICKEIHKRVDERLDTHDTRLNNHSERIDRLEQAKSRTDVKIENLCNQIENLVSVMKWFIFAMLGSLASFFIWYVQQLGR